MAVDQQANLVLKQQLNLVHLLALSLKYSALRDRQPLQIKSLKFNSGRAHLNSQDTVVDFNN